MAKFSGKLTPDTYKMKEQALHNATFRSLY